jgi:hypothetical protein
MGKRFFIRDRSKGADVKASAPFLCLTNGERAGRKWPILKNKKGLSVLNP